VGGDIVVELGTNPVVLGSLNNVDYFVNAGTLLEDFESGWNGAGANGSFAADTEHFKTGTQGIKVTSSDNNTFIIYKTVSWDLSVTESFAFWFYVDNVSKVGSPAYQFRLSSLADGSKYFYYALNPTKYRTGWNYVNIRKDDFTNVNGESWSNTMVKVWFAARAKAGATINVTFDSLILNSYATPKCVISFDDASASQYNVAFPYMQGLGLKGTIAVPGNLAGILTVSQLTEMQTAGWDIIGHSYNHVDLTTLSYAELVTELTNEINWLNTNGFYRGAYHSVTPYGSNSNVIEKVERQLGIKTSHTGIVALDFPANYNFQALSHYGISTYETLAAYKAQIDEAILYGRLVYLSFHRIVTPTSLTNDITAADFEALMDYIVASGIDVVTISEWYDGLNEGTGARVLADASQGEASVGITSVAAVFITESVVVTGFITTAGGLINRYLPGATMTTVEGRIYRYIATAGLAEGGGTTFLSHVSCSSASSFRAFGEVFFGEILRSIVKILARATISCTASASKLPAVSLQSTTTVVCRGTLFKAGKLKCTIDGIDRSSWVAIDTVQLTDELNVRNSARFRLNIPADAPVKPVIGSIIEFGNGVSVQFSGTIERMKKTMIGRSGVIYYDTEAVDWTQVCDRRLVARVYTNLAMSEVVYRIWNTYLKSEGLQLAIQDTGPIITKAVFNYQTVTDCFNEIAELTGYAWYVDYSKTIHFINRDSLTAPFAIDETMETSHVQELAIEETRSQYRNKEFVHVTRALTISKVVRFVGNGQQRSFPLVYPIAKKPENITLVNAAGGSLVQTIGVRGDGTDDKDWYYALNEKEITQNEDSQLWPSLTPFDTLVISYQGSYQTLITIQDDAEIAARIALEGGTGIYERVENDARLEEVQQGTEYAQSLLRRFGIIPKNVTFRTDLQGLKPGQILTMNMPTYGINYEDFLITEIEASDISGMFFRYQITCVSGEYLGSWVDFYKALAGVSLANNSYLIRDDEVILETYTVSDESFTITESIVVAEPSAISYFGTAKVDRSEV